VRVRDRLPQTTSAHPVPEREVGEPKRPSARQEKHIDFAEHCPKRVDRRRCEWAAQKDHQGEAIVTQLVNKSAAADLKATQIVLSMLRELESQDDGPADPAVFTEADHEIIRRIQARLRNENG
jgi:hypothetical protein